MPETQRRRVLIVGGVAAGASCAARLRRLDESVEIVIFDRGLYVSFANCGLPYHVGNVITDESKLLVASKELFHERFNIEVHTETEVVSIDRAARTVRTTTSALSMPPTTPTLKCERPPGACMEASINSALSRAER